MTTRHVEAGDFSEEQLRVQRAGEALHRDGASPAGALELLASIIEDRTWERVTDLKGRSFKGRFREFVADRASGLAYDPEQLPKVISLRHPHEGKPEVEARMKRMRTEVTAELRDDLSPALMAGRPTEKQCGTSFNTGTAQHVVKRLKRDDPELAERVVRGEITPNAAAREKGWRRPRVVVSSPDAVARSLLKHMSADDIAKLIAVLVGKDGDLCPPRRRATTSGPRKAAPLTGASPAAIVWPSVTPSPCAMASGYAGTARSAN